MRIGSYWDFSSSLKTSHVFNLCKTKSYILKSRSWFHCVTSLGINSSEAWPLHALLWPHIFEWKRQKSLIPGDTLVWLNIYFRICAGISSWFSSPLNNFSLVDDWNTEKATGTLEGKEQLFWKIWWKGRIFAPAMHIALKGPLLYFHTARLYSIIIFSS